MDREKIVKGLTDIGGFIAGRVGFEQAKNFLHTIDEAVAMLKEQEAAYQGAEELLRQKTILFDDAIKRLKEQEAVVQKTGHWIWLQFCANEGVYCSECHTKMFDCYPMKKKLSQFCGHCGAKMSDEVEGR